jgi:hypothetical protein
MVRFQDSENFMIIKIKNWNIFEKENGIGFTRNINIKDEIIVYAIITHKKCKYYLCFADFYTWNILMYIKDSSNIIIVDRALKDCLYIPRLTCHYVDYSDGYKNNIKIILKDVNAPKWMVENPSFFILVDADRNKAREIFNKSR